ncbi:MAG: restriction endonuclease subunit S [Owenweeksia sp.]
MREGWVEVQLGEACKFLGGGTPSKRNPSFWSGDLPWASIKDIKGDFLVKTQDYITEEGFDNSSTNLAYPNEIILGTRINPGRPIISKIKVAINQDLKVVRPKIDIYIPFLFYAIKNSEKGILKVSSGTTVLGVSLNNLNQVKFSLPPLPEQRAIVARLEQLFSELDNGMANLEKAREQLKVYRQAVLKKAFEGELTREWRERQTDLPTAEELLEQIKLEREKYHQQQLVRWNQEVKKWAENGRKDKKPKKPKPLTIPDSPNSIHVNRKWTIPENWIWSQLGYICFVTKLAGFEYTDYVTYVENGDLPVLKAENAGLSGFKKTDFSTVDSKSVEMLTRSQLFGGELLIVFVGAGTGNVAMVPLNERYFLGPNIGMARPYFKLDSKYLELFYQSTLGKNLMMSAVKAVAQPSLSMGTIRQTPIAFPSHNEQTQIVREIESRLSVADKLQETLEAEIERSRNLRQSILKKAFSGALLSEAERTACRQEADWEPAEALLKKIKH